MHVHVKHIVHGMPWTAFEPRRRVAAMPAVKKPSRVYRKHFIRKWREYRFPTRTMEEVADMLGIDRTTLGRIENLKSPYSQWHLEAMADLYQCQPWDLLNRDPSKEGKVIDITDELKSADPTLQAEILGWIRGRLHS